MVFGFIWRMLVIGYMADAGVIDSNQFGMLVIIIVALALEDLIEMAV